MMLVAAGCGDSVTVPLDNGGEASVELDGENVSIKGNDGELSIETDLENQEITFTNEKGETITTKTGGELPENFPSDIPLPENAVIEQASELKEENRNGYQVIYTTDEDRNSLFDRYTSYAENRGFTLDEQLKSDAVLLLRATGQEGGIYLQIIGQNDNTSQVILHYSDNTK